jgi:hypothetical protein
VAAFDPRSVGEVTRELARIAARTDVPGLSTSTLPITWADLLFDGDELSDTAEPSQALLLALAELQPGLDTHLASLVEASRRWWLETHLGIPRLDPVGDQVVAVATAEEDAAPVVVASGTELKGGRTSVGTERLYVTDDTLTVLGAVLAGVRGYHAGESRDHVSAWDDPSEPLAPFATDTPAPHHLDLITDAIAFEGGHLTVTVRFEGVSDGVVEQLQWWYSTAEGPVVADRESATSTQVVLRLDDRCQPYPLDGEPAVFLRAALPDGSFPATALDFEFTRVEVTASRERIPADGGYYNDGSLDVTKEFQPFGPTPRRGDSFYVRSDEAFSKPLSSLTVHLELLDEEGNTLAPVDFARPYQGHIVAEVQNLQLLMGDAAAAYSDFFGIFATGPPATALWWQRYRDDSWETFDTTGGTFGGDLPGGVPSQIGSDGSSEPSQVAGVAGRFIRVFLAQGDFGWNAYLERLAEFAAAAASYFGDDPDPEDLKPPTPPVVSSLRISYATKAVKVVDLRVTNGWSRRTLDPSDLLQPFFEPLPAVIPRPGGAVALGIDLGDSVLGSTLSAFLEIDAANACPSLGRPHDVRWQYWTSGGWRPLKVIDETSGLRQNGLLRLVAPLDWADGCREVDAGSGRWVRAVVSTPGQVGILVAIHLDAVLSTRVPDPDPNTPLAPEAIKGPRTRIAGIETFTNPAWGLPGRDTEPDGTYLHRASQVTRHRNRALQAWDYEQLVMAEEPRVAAVRCLPHTDADGNDAPGQVALVVVPGSEDHEPAPSVTLAERVTALLEPRMPLHAEVAVVCPRYVAVGVDATVVLVRGLAAADAQTSLTTAIDALLHPLAGGEPTFGRALYRSTVVAFLEGRPEVDHVESLSLRHSGGVDATDERIGVDPLRGLVASAGNHVLALEEQL